MLSISPVLLLLGIPVWTGDLSRPDLPDLVAQSFSVGEGSVRTLPAWSATDASPTRIVVGMSKAEVLAALKADWTGGLSVPSTALQGKDRWEVTEPWLHGQHFIIIRFTGGVVEDVSEVWISP